MEEVIIRITILLPNNKKKSDLLGILDGEKVGG